MFLEQGVTAQADLSGGTVESIKLTDGGFRKLLLRIRKNDVVMEIRLAPAEVADFADELQEVIDWLGEREPCR